MYLLVGLNHYPTEPGLPILENIIDSDQLAYEGEI